MPVQGTPTWRLHWLGYIFPNISHVKYRTDLILGEAFCKVHLLLFPRFGTSCINWFEIFVFEGVIVKTENTNLQLDKIARESRYVYTVHIVRHLLQNKFALDSKTHTNR